MTLPDVTRSALVALFYGICSLSMNFLNKIVLSSYEFNYPQTIMACQMLVTVVALETVRLLGFLPGLATYTWKSGREILPASFLFALHCSLSLSALHGMSIPMYGAIKRCTPLVNLALGILILRQPPPSKTIAASVFLITFGCLVASLGDLQFDGKAYAYGGLSVFAQGGYLTLVQKCSEEHKRSTVEMILLNGYNTFPFFVCMSLLTGEPSGVAKADCLALPGFHLALAVVISWSSVLNFSQFLCASVCSALTTSLVGAGKSVAQTWIGFFTFGGVPFHPVNVLGLALNVVGGFLYTHGRYHKAPLAPAIVGSSKRGSRSGSRRESGGSVGAGGEERHRLLLPINEADKSAL